MFKAMSRRQIFRLALFAALSSLLASLRARATSMFTTAFWSNPRQGYQLWAWGTVGGSSFSSPVLLSSATTWMQIEQGDGRAYAIKTNGSLWALGDNQSGELGDGSVVSKSTFIQIGSLTDWVSISSG